MTDYIKQIEQHLGAFKKLPNVPFYSNCKYALFPAIGDDLVDESLYQVLFEANKKQGNSYFIAKSLLDMKGADASILKQEELNWTEFESFQGSPLVYEGFYMTGENFDWLGIYHQDDYIIIGANNELTDFVTNQLYGIDDWQTKFDEAFKQGKMEMYEADYELLKKSLFTS